MDKGQKELRRKQLKRSRRRDQMKRTLKAKHAKIQELASAQSRPAVRVYSSADSCIVKPANAVGTVPAVFDRSAWGIKSD